MKLRKLGVLAFGAMLVAAACNTGGGATATPGAAAHRRPPSAALDKGTLKIGIDAAALGRRPRPTAADRSTACSSLIEQANEAGGSAATSSSPTR